MTTTSLVDKLNELGQASDLQSRANLAVSKGLVKTTQEYLSSAAAGTNGDINTQLLASLNTPPATAAPGTTTPTPAPASGTPAPSSYGSTAPAVSNNPLTSTQMGDAVNSPNPTTFVQANTGNSFADTISKVAAANITASNTQAIDTLRAQLQASQAEAKSQAEANVAADKSKINSIVNSTAAQDALNSSLETFKVKENLALYSDIQTKIVEAQKALDMGLIYEGDRPARMKFITGSEATLQKQGLATIGALQGTAAVIKGNIDLAKSFADATVNAINSDNERSFKALTTLLDLDNQKLVTLTADEKGTINDRITFIEKQAEELKKNKDDVVTYMTTYPQAFLKGGVTLLDSKETALKKMLPYLSAAEAAKEQADLAYKQSQTNLNNAQARKAGAAGSSSGAAAVTAAELTKYKSDLTSYKANGMTYEDAINAYADVVPISYINDLYGQKDSMTFDQKIQQQYQSQFFNNDGSLKEGYTYPSKPDANGNIIPVKTTSSGGGIWSSVKSFFGF